LQQEAKPITSRGGVRRGQAFRLAAPPRAVKAPRRALPPPAAEPRRPRISGSACYSRDKFPFMAEKVCLAAAPPGFTVEPTRSLFQQC
jgi:hypothetical protein